MSHIATSILGSRPLVTMEGIAIPLDPEIRRQLAKQGRLWLLALICATVGSVTVWRADSLQAGILAFLLVASSLGAALWAYERRRK